MQDVADFEKLANAAPVMMWVTDPAGRCVFLNKTWYDFTGQTAAQAEGFGWLDATHPADRAEAERIFLDANARQVSFRLEYRLRGGDGVYRWAIDLAKPRFSGSGEFLGFVGSVIDIEDRHEAEAKLEFSEERLRLATDAADIGFWDVDVVQDLLFWPARVRRMFGMSEDEPVSLTDFYEGLHPDDRHRTARAYAAACDPQIRAIYDVEYRTIGKNDGVVRTVAAKGRAIFDSSGRCLRVLGAAIDITANRRAQTDLRDSEARYRALFEALDVGFCVVEVDLDRGGRTDYRVVEANRAFYLQTGFPEDIFGRWLREAAPSLEERWFEAYGRVAREGEPIRFEEASAALGRWFDVYAYPAGEKDHRRVAILFNDVSERRRAEAQLRANLQRMPAFVAVLSGPDHVYEFANEANTRVFGERSFVGRAVRDVFPDLEDQAFFELMDGVYATGEPFSAQAMPIRLGDEGQVRHIDLLYEPIVDRGEVTGIFAGGYDVSERIRAEQALQDLNAGLEQAVSARTSDLQAALEALKAEATERERAEAALRQSQKLESMGQLTGGVAHDFNNLLTPIIGALDLLQKRGLGGEREQRLIAGAIDSAERAKVLVQRLLAFARRQPLQARSVDISHLVRNMAELIASTTGPQIRVVVDVPPVLAPASADPNQIEMALLNLAVNARDAMPDGGTLRISATEAAVGGGDVPGLREGDYLCLSVADTGVGMDQATLARAVEPFFSTKGVGKGTGLGLSMAHGLASQLGGLLRIQSHPGIGTNVEIWLPVSKASPSSQEPTQALMAASSRRSGAGEVLLVDDEEAVRATTAAMLSEFGFEVVEACSAEHAFKLIGEGLRPSLLVTDHLMPGLRGADLARQLRDALPSLKVLVVSGYAEDEGLPPDIPQLTKPFRSDELATVLASL
jgi:PAS domain S-box-containing protein